MLRNFDVISKGIKLILTVRSGHLKLRYFFIICLFNTDKMSYTSFAYPDPRNKDLHDDYLDYMRSEIDFVLGTLKNPILKKCYRRSLDLRLDKKQFWEWFGSWHPSCQDRYRKRWEEGFDF